MSTEQIDRTDHPSTEAETGDITLLEGEELLENVRPSWINWWILFLVSAIVSLLGFAVLLSGELLGVVVILLAGLLVLYVRYARERSRYIVTNQRVKKRVGLARKTTGETRIAKIRGLSTEQGLLERLVGKGSVLIDSGAASGKLGINGVSDYDQLANTIREQQRLIEQD